MHAYRNSFTLAKGGGAPGGKGVFRKTERDPKNRRKTHGKPTKEKILRAGGARWARDKKEPPQAKKKGSSWKFRKAGKSLPSKRCPRSKGGDLKRAINERNQPGEGRVYPNESGEHPYRREKSSPREGKINSKSKPGILDQEAYKKTEGESRLGGNGRSQ